jgi:hypothetical protein
MKTKVPGIQLHCCSSGSKVPVSADSLPPGTGPSAKQVEHYLASMQGFVIIIIQFQFFFHRAFDQM